MLQVFQRVRRSNYEIVSVAGKKLVRVGDDGKKPATVGVTGLAAFVWPGSTPHTSAPNRGLYRNAVMHALAQDGYDLPGDGTSDLRKQCASRWWTVEPGAVGREPPVVFPEWICRAICACCLLAGALIIGLPTNLRTRAER